MKWRHADTMMWSRESSDSVGTVLQWSMSLLDWPRHLRCRGASSICKTHSLRLLEYVQCTFPTPCACYNDACAFRTGQGTHVAEVPPPCCTSLHSKYSLCVPQHLARICTIHTPKTLCVPQCHANIMMLMNVWKFKTMLCFSERILAQKDWKYALFCGGSKHPRTGNATRQQLQQALRRRNKWNAHWGAYFDACVYMPTWWVHTHTHDDSFSCHMCATSTS